MFMARAFALSGGGHVTRLFGEGFSILEGSIHPVVGSANCTHEQVSISTAIDIVTETVTDTVLAPSHPLVRTSALNDA